MPTDSKHAWLAILALLCAPQAMAEPAETEAATAILTITFDDGALGQYENGLRLAKQYGVRGTLFLRTQGPAEPGGPQDPWSMSWENVREFAAAGWEIGSHTNTHPYLTQLSPEQVEIELGRAFADIVRHTGVVPTSFASPFGDFNDSVIGTVRKYYDNHLASWGGNEGRNPLSGVDHYKVRRLDVQWTHTADQVCAEIGKAAADPVWLVLIFHNIVDGAPLEYQASAKNFEGIMRCAADLSDQNVLEIKTVREALRDVPDEPEEASGS